MKTAAAQVEKSRLPIFVLKVVLRLFHTLIWRTQCEPSPLPFSACLFLLARPTQQYFNPSLFAGSLNQSTTVPGRWLRPRVLRLLELPLPRSAVGHAQAAIFAIFRSIRTASHPALAHKDWRGCLNSRPLRVVLRTRTEFEAASVGGLFLLDFNFSIHAVGDLKSTIIDRTWLQTATCTIDIARFSNQTLVAWLARN